MRTWNVERSILLGNTGTTRRNFFLEVNETQSSVCEYVCYVTYPITHSTLTHAHPRPSFRRPYWSPRKLFDFSRWMKSTPEEGSQAPIKPRVRLCSPRLFPTRLFWHLSDICLFGARVSLPVFVEFVATQSSVPCVCWCRIQGKATHTGANLRLHDMALGRRTFK